MKIKYVHLLGAAYLAAFIISSALTGFQQFTVLTFSGGYLFIYVLQALMVRFQRKEVIQRTLDFKQEAGHAVIILMLLAGIATMVMASLHLADPDLPLMASWTQMLGFVLLLVGHFIAVQAINSQAPFAETLYQEAPSDNREAGTYTIIRHPLALSAVMIMLSIPLCFMTPWAFLPAGIGVILTIIWVSILDHWRFVNYDWYYDYSQSTPFRILPFIW